MKPKEISISSPGRKFRNLGEIPVWVALGFLVIFGAAAFNLVDFSVSKEKVKLDAQVMIKLGIASAAAWYGGLGFITDRRVRDLFFSLPGLFFTIIVLCLVLSVPTAVDSRYALASSGALGAILFATATATVQLGLRDVLNAIFYGVSFFIVGSWILYFAVPDVGVFAEPLADGETIKRMSGLAHPNTLGQFSSFTIILGVILYVTYGYRSSWRVAVVLLAVIALLASLSRSSMVATMAAVLFAYRGYFFQPKHQKYYLAAIFFGLIGLMAASVLVDIPAYVESKMAVFSKSGDSAELTSATGRTEIWAYCVRMIGERPLLGWGAASSKYVLADYLGYAHNLVLNLMLSGGVACGLSALCLLFYRFREFVSKSHPLDGVLVFIFINGLFENVVFTFLAGAPTMLLFLSTIFWRLEDDEAVYPLGQTSESPRKF